MSRKERRAKWIRILTTPQISAMILVSILAVRRKAIFHGIWDYGVSVFFLGIFPLLAYPIAHVIPAVRGMGRKGERQLAFVFCLLGYLILNIYGLCVCVDQRLSLLYEMYFFSGLILVSVNVFLHIKASGHACGITGPILLAGSLMGWQWSAIFTVVFLLSAWASLTLERHTMREFILGSACCVAGFVIGMILMNARFIKGFSTGPGLRFIAQAQSSSYSGNCLR